MGRVLPSLETRTGITSVADALGATKDQQLQNALRRAARTKAEERKTPEGMMKFIGNLAQTAGQVAGTADKIGSLVGKIPLPEAIRSAATAKTASQMVAPQVKELIEGVVREQGVGQGAPVTTEVAEVIERIGGQGQPGRIAAAALGEQVDRDREMRAFRDRSAAAESEVEQLQQGLLPVEKVEDLAAEEVTEQAMRATQEAEQAVDEATQQQRQAEQLAVADTMARVEDVTEADIERMRAERVAETLGSTPRERQDRLLALAKSAFGRDDQARLLEVAEMIDIEPTRVSDLFDTRGSFRRKLAKAFPTAAQQLSAQKGLSVDARATARLESAADRLRQQREIETERQELRSDKEKRLAEGQTADDDRADERLEFNKEQHRFAVAKDARRREEWGYDFAFKQQKHKDLMENGKAIRDLRDRISRRAGKRAGRREGLDNARNVNRAIANAAKAASSLTKEIGSHIKQANSAVRQIESEKLRYKQKLANMDRKKQRAYERRVLKPNGGKDPVIQDYDERISDAKTDVSNLKNKKQAASGVISDLGKLSNEARMPGSMMNYEQSLRFLDTLREIHNGIDNNIFGENQ